MIAEEFTVFGFINRFGGCADHLDIEFFEHAHFFKRKRAVQSRLSTHGGKQRIRPFFFDDLGDDFRCDRFDISAIRHIGIGHDGRRIGIDQNDTVAFFLERFDRLGA